MVLLLSAKTLPRGMYFHNHNEKIIRPQKFVKVANIKKKKVANIMKKKSCLQKVCKSYPQKHKYIWGRVFAISNRIIV